LKHTEHRDPKNRSSIGHFYFFCRIYGFSTFLLHYNHKMIGEHTCKNSIQKNCTQSISLSTLSRCFKKTKIKLFINYKREMYALAHLNLSIASFKYLS